ncbi:MAG: thioredoxin [Candidatus Marinimicrobia bacterium]|nr:thioredoxin [Candidatus Neomarinimicrobiota bacterium]|tara:strand:+ start:1182 stop:1505 length:324 start_codon:yes stop_codon:yes gene_type:complete
MSDKAVELNDDNFEESIKSGKVVLVDFWAEWCGPCKMLTPIIDELAKDFEGKAIISKVNVDNSPNIAQKYSIRSIPSILFFKDGNVEEQMVGVVPKEEITKTINDLM